VAAESTTSRSWPAPAPPARALDRASRDFGSFDGLLYDVQQRYRLRSRVDGGGLGYGKQVVSLRPHNLILPGREPKDEFSALNLNFTLGMAAVSDRSTRPDGSPSIRLRTGRTSCVV
jgi:hypothetical protein